MDDLLVSQARLQAEADALVAALDLTAELEKLGPVTRVGSSALGLMVRRDIDLTVSCSKLDAATLAAFAELGARLMQRTDLVVGVRFRNDAGNWNAEPEKYPDGLYLGLTVRTAEGASWTFDIWLVDQPERQPDLAHLRTLLPRLTDESRRSILAIKHELAKGDGTEPRLPSALVYEAVMDHGVPDLAGFEAWYAGRAR
ncbi:MAG TPA: hypothetical protein VGV07_02860 [Devosia sp.]|uniref:hypothetical protein n=1 Tax=Devosia sp. TaxID=1871048 RepID=UPI002DDD0E4C|nr:hypothetical protein [Devosia sp.]HEV2514166.1 hypothetical protein [Devosia sp.]